MRLALLLVLPSLFAAPALTAATDVPPGAHGFGSGAISGYEVSSIGYELEGETIAGVSFSLEPASARTVRARLAPDEPWTPCTVAAGVARCPVATPLARAEALDVVAAG